VVLTDSFHYFRGIVCHKLQRYIWIR